MSANETIHTSETGGQKAGNDERYDLLPSIPLLRLAIHAGHMPPGRRGSMADLCDHLWRFWSGEEFHAELDLPNLPAVAWHAMRLADGNVAPYRDDAVKRAIARAFNATVAEAKTTRDIDASDDATGTPRYDLIPAEPLRLLALHFGVGARKYDDDNWRRGYSWGLSFAALNRHLWQWWAGEEIDEETGSPHLIAVAWHALVLDEFTRIHPEFDSRPTSAAARLARNPEAAAKVADALAHVGDAVRVEVAAPVMQLDASHKGRDWRDEDGDVWTWAEENRGGGPGWAIRLDDGGLTSGGALTVEYFGPFTPLPRVVDELGDAERDAEWIDADGDRWCVGADGYWAVNFGGKWEPTDPARVFGPYTEVIAADTESTTGQ